MTPNIQPIVGFFRERRDIEDFVFKAPRYQQAYHEIIDQLNEKGVYVAILMGQSSYLGQGRFSKHWVQVNQNGVYSFEKRGPITVDLVFEKDRFNSDGKVMVLNNPELRNLCWDKHASYELLHDFHPKSIIADNLDELDNALADLPGELVAVKNLSGNSGQGVFVGLKKDFVFEDHPFIFPVQAQEYIETSAGVPGITDKRHDVRVVLANGEPVLSTLRTPPEGSLKSNIGFGGETRLIGLDELPQELFDLCSKIDERLAKFSEFRLYSADFGLTANGWRLFEVNAMPGTINRDRGEQALYYQDKLTDLLRDAAVFAQTQKGHHE